MMEKRYSGFLIALMLIACKLLYCNAFLESPVKKKYVPNIRLKEEILKLAKDSLTEGILKVRRELRKNLEDLRLDMMRRDVELYEEIYNVHENLTGNDTAKEKQTTNLDDGERKVWIKKFEYLEAGIKKTAQDSKINADTLQENMERLDRENRRILSRMDTMEISLLRVASVNLNDSEELIFTNYLQKLQYEDERLNNINETMQDICNSTTEMLKAIETFQSEVLTLKSSIDALNVHVNLTINDNTIEIQNLADLSENNQLNMTKVLNENEQYFSKELFKLMRNVSEVYNLSTSNLNSLQDLLSQEKQLEMQVIHSRQDLKNEMTVLKNQLNITVTNFEDMKDKQVEISNDLINISLNISFISDAWNAINEELGILNNSLSGKLTDFKTQVQLDFKENLNKSEQLTNITATVNDLQRQVYDIVQQQMTLEADKEQLLLLKNNITNHGMRIGDIVTIAQLNSDTLSRIQSNITALMEITGALNRSLSQQITERNQQQLLVRLVGGRAAGEGRVEIYHSNVWGTICDDSWSSSDARVVCRMLGYSGSYTAYSSAQYGQGSGQIWLDEVGCSGLESSIFSCSHNGWGVHDCSHSEDASVKCT